MPKESAGQPARARCGGEATRSRRTGRGAEGLGLLWWSCLWIETLAVIFLGLSSVWAFASARDLRSDARASWWTLESPHFEVHFEEGFQELAQEVALKAERAHGLLVPEVGYEPGEKTHVVIRDTGDLPGASVEHLYFNKILLVPAYPSGVGYSSGIGLGFNDWLELLILHEYAHVLHLDMNSGLTSTLRKTFGKIPVVSSPNLRQSYAMVEGYATYLEALTDPGGRGRGPLFDMFLRAAVLEDRLLERDQILGRYDLEQWLPGGTVYLYGYSLIEYIAHRYGTDKLREMNQRFSGMGFPAIGKAFEQVFGRSYSDLWGEWADALKARYSAQAEQITGKGLSAPALVPASGRPAVGPSFSPDGTRAVYGSVGRVSPVVRVISLADPADDKELVHGLVLGTGRIAWTPNGGGLVYAKAGYVGGRRLVNDLYEYDLDSGKERRLTKDLRASAPSVAPDGRTVAFVVREGITTKIAVIDRTIGQASFRVIHEPDDRTQYLAIAWAPDGKSLAVSAWRPGGYTDVYLMEWSTDPSGDGALQSGPMLRPLFVDKAVDTNPSWSPSGRFIIFESDRSGVYNLYAFDTQDRKFFKVTNVLYGAFVPTVSPDGRHILFMNYTADGYQLAMLPWEPSGWEEIALPTSVSRSGMEAAAAAQEAQDAAEYPIRPYSPLQTLRPKFWLPVLGIDESGLELGVGTAGADVLGEQSYAVQLKYGLASGRASYNLEYNRSFGGLEWLLAGYRPSATLRVSEGVTIDLSLGELRPQRQQRLLAQLSLERPRVGGTSEFVLGLERKSVLDPFLGEEPDPVGADLTEAIARWRYRAVTSHDERRRQRDLELEVAGVLDNSLAGPGIRVLGSFGVYYETRPDEGVALDAVLGYAGGATRGFLLGGKTGDFQVRGYGEGAAVTDQAGRLSIEYRRPLKTFDRGREDSPVFLNKLVLSSFFDTAFSLLPEQPGPATSALAGFGGELSLSTQPAYGAASMDWKLGWARPLDGSLPSRFYVVVESRF